MCVGLGFVEKNAYTCAVDPENYICLRCQHYQRPGGFGCRAFPGGIPYGFPPGNRHARPLPGQVGRFVFALDPERVPDAELVLVYLENEKAPDRDLVALLPYAVGAEKAPGILRRCLSGGRRLVAVYPMLNEKAPAGAEYLGDIIDGALYLV